MTDGFRSMNSSDQTRRRRWLPGLAALLLSLVVFSGCKGILMKEEKEARQQVQMTAGRYRPNGGRPALPVLGTNSSLGDFLTYAMLNQPKVEAAYYDWAASVERITTEAAQS